MLPSVSYDDDDSTVLNSNCSNRTSQNHEQNSLHRVSWDENTGFVTNAGKRKGIKRTSQRPKQKKPENISDVKRKLAEALNVIEIQRLTAKGMEQDLTELRNTVNELNEENDELLDDMDAVIAEKEEMKAKLEEVQETNKGLIKERDQLAHQVKHTREAQDQQYPDDVTELVDRIRSQTKRAMKKAATERSTLETELKRVKARLEEKSETIEEMTKDRELNVKKLKMELERNQTIAEVRKDKNKLSKQLGKMEEAMTNLHSYTERICVDRDMLEAQVQLVGDRVVNTEVRKQQDDAESRNRKPMSIWGLV